MCVCVCVCVYQFSSVQYSCSVVPDSLRPHGLKHTRLHCPSLSPGVCSDSCPLSWWYYPTISSCAAHFSLPSVFPSIKVFSNELAFHIRWPNCWIFSFSISPSSEYLELISFRIDCWILLSKGLSRVLSNTTDQEHQFFGTQPSLWSNCHIHTWLLEKP